MLFHYHDGEADFPHGAGASEPGWYIYTDMADDEPSGPLIAVPVNVGYADEAIHYFFGGDELPYISAIKSGLVKP